MPRRLEATDLPEDIARLAQAQVASGRFATVEDVVRAGVEAVARAQPDDTELAELRSAIDEGDESGVFEDEPFAEVRARYGLWGTPR
ncbi:MAG TPA: type II toxin-antitoxin system ParD family antitoxin [Polyangiaceae bacterium]|nr:type II toxin-antitoxin system ParD family antitoxin [Polyangiaceae bacterium]